MPNRKNSPMPLKGTAERAALRKRVVELVDSGEKYRDICVELGLATINAVGRLYYEEHQVYETEERRAAHRAFLDSWAERLEEAVAPVLHGDKPEAMALLVQAAVRLDESRRKLDGTDKPQAPIRFEQVNGTQPGDAPSTEAWLRAMAKEPMFVKSLKLAGFLRDEPGNGVLNGVGGHEDESE